MRANFVLALEKLIVRGVYVGIATHDEYLVCRATGLLDEHGLPRNRYEFQMLLGVDEELRRILIDVATGCGCMCRTGRIGTRTRCGGCRRTLRWRGTC